MIILFYRSVWKVNTQRLLYVQQLTTYSPTMVNKEKQQTTKYWK